MKLPPIQSKVVSRDDLIALVNQWRKAGDTVAFTNGVFDILHRGHIQSIAAAASFADRLVVGVNNDASVKSLQKGAERPINAERDRALLVAALASVDAVTIFPEPTPYELLEMLRPDVLVKGSDYKLEEIVGREFAGRVERVELVQGFSTTGMIEKLKK